MKIGKIEKELKPGCKIKVKDYVELRILNTYTPVLRNYTNKEFRVIDVLENGDIAIRKFNYPEEKFRLYKDEFILL